MSQVDEWCDDASAKMGDVLYLRAQPEPIQEHAIDFQNSADPSANVHRKKFVAHNARPIQAPRMPRINIIVKTGRFAQSKAFDAD
jgi:hypothetical protein